MGPHCTSASARPPWSNATIIRRAQGSVLGGLQWFVFCILHFVFCILYFVFCILYSVLCIMYFALCILYFVFWSEEHLSVWCGLQWCTALTSADRSTGPIHCWSMLWIEALFQVGCSVGTLTNSMYGKVHHRLHACLLTMVNGTGGVVIWSVLWYSFGQCATNASPRVAHTSRLTSADTQPPPLSTNQQNLLVPIPHVPPLKLTLNIGQTWDSEFYKVLINFCQELGIFFRTKKRSRGSRPPKQNIVRKKICELKGWKTCGRRVECYNVFSCQESLLVWAARCPPPTHFW